MEKIKVLVVGLTGGVGGVETFICSVNRFINHDRFQMDYLVHQDIQPQYTRNLQANGGTIYRIPGIKKGLLPFWKGISSFYRSHPYDIVHLNECGASFFIYVLPLLFQHRAKLIVHSHNGDSQKKGWHVFFRFFQDRRLNARWACSEVAARWMFGDKQPATIIHNGIQLSRYRYDEESRSRLRRELGLGDKFVLGSVARFEKQKNHRGMIEMFAAYKAVHPHSCLVLVGDGGERQEIQRLVREKQLEQDVLFLGIRQDVQALLSLFDVFLLPSLYEGLPFVAIEAQAAALPMLVSDTVSEEINLTSLVTRVGLSAPVDAWCAALEQLRTHPVDRSSPAYGEALARAGYDIEDSVRKIELLYQNLVWGKQA